MSTTWRAGPSPPARTRRCDLQADDERQGALSRLWSGTACDHFPVWYSVHRGATAAFIEEPLMALYELRTYTLRVGAMAEAVKLYQELGFPALHKGGHDRHLVGYFQADTGTINQLVHLWKFEDDADRRAHWAAVFANKDFVDGSPQSSGRW
jgi:NIPSNAP protein